MKKILFLLIPILIAGLVATAQSDSVKISQCKAHFHNYEVKQAFEVESLFPMFLTGGFHVAAGYRFDKFRIRFSIINGGSYDAEAAGINNSSANYKRYYKTSPGIFLGYNLWRNLEAYTYLEFHTFEIEQKSTGIRKNLHSTDTGCGISYQFFVGNKFYIQPGFHVYLRGSHSLEFGNEQYHISRVDLAPVLRIGYRFRCKH